MSGTLKNYYEILGVPRSASSDQIRTAYRKLLLKFHPDKNVGDEYFEDWSKKINEAFEVLMDPQIRSEYDKVYDQSKATSRPRESEIYKNTPNNHYEEQAVKAETINGEQVFEKPVEGPDNQSEEVDNAVNQPMVTESIDKLVPDYISAKKDVVRAKRNFLDAEQKVKSAKRDSTNLQMAIAAVIILAVGSWMIFSYTKSDDKEKVYENGLVVLPSKPNKTETQANDVLQTPAKPPVVAPKPNSVIEPKDEEITNLEFRVSSNRAYFYDKPDGTKSASTFLSKGNKFIASKKVGKFYYGYFPMISNPGYKMEGWIHADELQSITP